MKWMVNSYERTQPLVHLIIYLFQIYRNHVFFWQIKLKLQLRKKVSEEGRDYGKSSWPLWIGLYMCYNENFKKKQRISELIFKHSQNGLFSATWKYEGGIASNRKSEKLRWICTWALYKPPVTVWEVVCFKWEKWLLLLLSSVINSSRRWSADWDEVVTR